MIHVFMILQAEFILIYLLIIIFIDIYIQIFLYPYNGEHDGHSTEHADRRSHVVVELSDVRQIHHIERHLEWKQNSVFI